MEFEEQVSVALRAAAGTITPPVDQLVRAAEREGERLRRRRSRLGVAAGGAVGLAAAGIVAFGPGLRAQAPARPPAGGSATSSAAACPVPVETGPPPTWASTGFSDPAASGVPFVVGAQGHIAAILFGYPLSVPEAAGRSNKVLWVSRAEQQPMKPLVIEARLADSTQSVHREIPGGPGPSSLDLPQPGCWHLSLSWDGGQQRDTMDLTYTSPS